jgi:hypothetical protein
MSDHVKYDFQNGVATITMDDGKVNVMSTRMLGEISVAFDRAESDRAITVLRSARPGIFSAGFDLKIFAANDVEGGLEMVKAGCTHRSPGSSPNGPQRSHDRNRYAAAVVAGFLDRAVPGADIESVLEATLGALRAVHGPSHAVAKTRLRRATQAAMRRAIDEDLTLAAYRSGSASIG